MTAQGTAAYLVTSGHHSALIPYAVFSSLKAAQDWAEAHRVVLSDDPTGHPTVQSLAADPTREMSPDEAREGYWICWELIPPYRDDPGGWREFPLWMA